MSTLKNLKNKPIHSRNINITTYEYNENSIIVEGELKDNRLISSYNIFGELHQPNIIHNMIIRILVEAPEFFIKDVEVEMHEIPRSACIETQKSLEWLKGEKIEKGFTLKIKKKVGAGKGCQHLSTLMLAMCPAVLQGFGILGGKKKIKNEKIKTILKIFLTDTCYVWRKKGPLIKKMTETVENKD